jgi:4-hydroxybenzoate polyprenyltransferase/phosphoserine phosphatase
MRPAVDMGLPRVGAAPSPQINVSATRAAMSTQNPDAPLCVDCDGTLIRTDLLHESVFLMLKSAPWKLPLLPFWLLRGKAYMKLRLAESVKFEWDTLPLNEEVVALTRAARDSGRRTVLATASHRLLAEAFAPRLGLFDEIIATDGGKNLSGANKREVLVARFGERGYDYVGNSGTDLKVWSSARRAIVVSPTPSLAKRAEQVTSVERVIAMPRAGLAAYLKGLRLHQWLKNLLIFVPMLAAHQLAFGGQLRDAVIAFFAFSFCASSVYVLNDLLDLASDRQHVRKRNRPFASGVIPISHGAVLIPLLLVLAFGLASMLPAAFIGILAIYFVFTLSYSLALKRQVVVDVLMLAGLYTLRVVAGGAATQVVPSFWLLAFSMFVFLSLAVVKRYSELYITLQQNKSEAAGRGYSVQDLPVLMSMGTSSGMVAVLVFALYINNPDITRIYKHPEWLWLVPPLLLYWVSRLWMKTHRGEIDDDPVVFAIKDWQSLAVVAIAGVLFLLA